MIETSRFEIIDFCSVMGSASYSLQLLQDATAGFCPRFLQPVFFGSMQLLIQIADRLTSRDTRLQDACAFVVIFFKRLKSRTSFAPIGAAIYQPRAEHSGVSRVAPPWVREPVTR